jgi:hypothetical protein
VTAPLRRMPTHGASRPSPGTRANATGDA